MEKREISKEELSQLNGGAITTKSIDGLTDKALYMVYNPSNPGDRYSVTKSEIQKLIDVNPDKAQKYVLYPNPVFTASCFDELTASRSPVSEDFYK